MESVLEVRELTESEIDEVGGGEWGRHAAVGIGAGITAGGFSYGRGDSLGKAARTGLAAGFSAGIMSAGYGGGGGGK